MRAEIALSLLFLFIPCCVIVLALRDWRQYRDWSWPPPLSLPISIAIAVGLLANIWRVSMTP